MILPIKKTYFMINNIYFYTKYKFYSIIIVYMCMKLLPRDLNSNSCPPYPTSTYTYGVTILKKLVTY